MTTLNGNDVIAIIKKIKDNVKSNRERLTDLDSVLGDGDLGITMCRGFEEVCKALSNFNDNDIGKILTKTGMILAQTAPSTMGTLIASGFMKAGKAVSGKDELSLIDITELMDAFMEGITSRGKAAPGDKTIIDALTPAVEEFRKAVKEGKSLDTGLSSAYEASVKGAENAKEMAAKHGRPAYYGEKSIGEKDPGAEVGVLILKAFAEYGM